MSEFYEGISQGTARMYEADAVSSSRVPEPPSKMKRITAYKTELE